MSARKEVNALLMGTCLHYCCGISEFIIHKLLFLIASSGGYHIPKHFNIYVVFFSSFKM